MLVDCAIYADGLRLDAPADVLEVLLPQSVVGRAENGHGWFVDATPSNNTEFVMQPDAGNFVAEGTSPAAGRIDPHGDGAAGGDDVQRRWIARHLCLHFRN